MSDDVKSVILQLVPAAPGWNAVTWSFDPMALRARAELEPIACWALVEHTPEDGEVFRRVYPVTAGTVTWGDNPWDEDPDEIAAPGAEVDELHDHARSRMFNFIHGELHAAGWESSGGSNPRWTPPGGGEALYSGDAYKAMVKARKAAG